MATKKSNKRPVIVTTEHRGVFFGYTDAAPTAKEAELTDCRMIVSWSAETRGVVGLARRGPQRGSRVSPAVDRAGIVKITAIFDATSEAAKACEAEPWA